MPSINKVKGTTFAGANLPKLRLDPLVSDGTILCYDFLNKNCWNGNNPAADNANVIDLAENYNGVLANPTSGVTFNTGLDFNAGSAYINAGQVPLSGKSVVIILWVAYGTQTEANSAWMGAIEGGAYSNVNGQFVWWSGTASADQLRLKYIDSAGGVLGWPSPTFDGVGQIVQMAIHADINGADTQFNTYLRKGTGSLQNLSTDVVPDVQGLNNTTLPLGIMACNGNGERNQIRGKLYRTFIEDLGVSGRSAVDVLKADWDKNRSRFS